MQNLYSLQFKVHGRHAKSIKYKKRQHWIQTAMKGKDHSIKATELPWVGGDSLVILNMGQILLGASSVRPTVLGGVKRF